MSVIKFHCEIEPTSTLHYIQCTGIITRSKLLLPKILGFCDDLHTVYWHNYQKELQLFKVYVQILRNFYVEIYWLKYKFRFITV
jgi:hypothetical protein